METFYCIVGIVSGILNLILFFKIWGMTNRVKDIYTIMSGRSQIQSGWGYEELGWYCEDKINQAKKMIAIGDDGAEKVIKGLIYDLESMNKEKAKAWGVNKYVDIAKEILDNQKQ